MSSHRKISPEMELNINGLSLDKSSPQISASQTSASTTSSSSHNNNNNNSNHEDHHSFRSPRSSSTYTSNINADIQAKLLAFQEQRQLKSAQQDKDKDSNSSMSSPIDHPNKSSKSTSNSTTGGGGGGESPSSLLSSPNLPEPTTSTTTTTPTPTTTTTTTTTSSTVGGVHLQKPIAVGLTRKKSLQQNKNLNNSNNTSGIPQSTNVLNSHTAEKPLPPLPNTPPTINNGGSFEKNLKFNPARPAPSLPVNSQVSPQVAARLPRSKPSLSMRRGMKLPGGLPTLNNDQSSTNTSSTQSTSSSTQSSSTSTSTSQQPLQQELNGSRPEVPSMKSSGSVTNLIEKKGKLPPQQSMQLKGLFANYSKYIDIKSGSLNFKGKLSLDSKGVDFSSGSSFRISSDELEFIEELGRGNYGTVSKVLHKPTGITMAMKEVRLELDESKFRQILMELEVLHKCNSPFIVDFYGAFFVEGAVYMCMEFMDGGSLDKIYGEGVDEPHLAFITESVIKGLYELKETHNIIHRDIKPTNILVSTSGKVKLCDFGVSGNLVASLAKTNIGCQSYMAPERIKSLSPDDVTYSVQSDIWSLGLTMLETAKGSYPYPPETYDNIFSQLSAIVDGDPPSLPDSYSTNARNFVGQCLEKNPNKRPNYSKLLQHPWLLQYRNVDVHMDEYLKFKLTENSHLKDKKEEKDIEELNKKLKKTPALHRGGAPNPSPPQSQR